MRHIPFLLFILLLAGCSSGSSEPVTPSNNDAARINLSAPYVENSYDYIDVNLENVPQLYQFSMRFEFNPDCIEFIEFEPSSDFGPEPLLLQEKIRNVPAELAPDLVKPDNNLAVIAVSRPYPHLKDIISPGYLGRIRFKSKCTGNNAPFRVFSHPDYLVFRDYKRNRIDIQPDGTTDFEGGDR